MTYVFELMSQCLSHSLLSPFVFSVYHAVSDCRSECEVLLVLLHHSWQRNDFYCCSGGVHNLITCQLHKHRLFFFIPVLHVTKGLKVQGDKNTYIHYQCGWMLHHFRCNIHFLHWTIYLWKSKPISRNSFHSFQKLSQKITDLISYDYLNRPDLDAWMWCIHRILSSGILEYALKARDLQ